MKSVVRDLVRSLGVTDLAKVFKDNQEHAGIQHRDLIKKLGGKNITWMTYRQVIFGLGLKEVSFTITMEVKVSSDGKTKEVSGSSQMDEGVPKPLATNEIRDMLDDFFKNLEFPQQVICSRIEKWLMSKGMDSGIKVRTTSFIKKLSNDKVSWATLLDVIDVLEAENVRFTIKHKDGEVVSILKGQD
jgi:hypothetical protein